jgi:hypothetical protein
MNLLKPLAILLIPLILAAPSLAQASSVDIPAGRDDIEKLFEVMQIRQQMRLVLDSVKKQQSELVHDTMKKRYPDITDLELARIDDLMAETMKDFPVDGMLDDMIPVYQKHLTKPDVDAMISFYSSPTGQKILREMPAMTSEGMQAAYGRLQKQIEAMMDRVQKMIQRDEQKHAPPKPQPQSKPKPKPPSSPT